ncbi:MAG: CrcB family protein [Balneolales bacterium]
MIYLAVALAGGMGAISRFLMDTWVRSLLKSEFPWGIFVVNISGSLALGIVAGMASVSGMSEVLIIALTTGFLGAYTTFSGWMVQSLQLMEAKAWVYAMFNIFASIISGILATAAGLYAVFWLV